MLLLFGVMLLLLMLGMEIGVAMGLSGMVYIVYTWFGPTPIPLHVIAQNFLYGLDSFPILAVPLFIFAGELMNRGGITYQLIRFSNALIGHVTGGLGNVSVVANLIMSGMSGSSAADCSATGSILIPSMIKKKYPPEMAAAIIACAATIGPIIPPSIPFVVIGGMTGVSIGRLFLGGVIPGVLMGLTLLVATYFMAKRYGLKGEHKFDVMEVLRSFRSAFLALLTPFIILGSMIFGVATPTEAAAVAVGYALFAGFVIYKELTLKIVIDVLKHCAILTGSIMFTVAGAAIISWVALSEQFGPNFARLVISITDNPILILLLINVVLFVVGFPLEPFPIIMIFIPILMPVITKLGIDPVHFIVMFTVNIQLALITPPVGTNLFLVSAMAKSPVGKVSVAAIPYLVALIVSLLIITIWPPFTLWLPNLLMN